MLSDIQIANAVNMQNIVDVAKKIGLNSADLELYGNYKAKIKKLPQNPQGKLVLVSAINPTKAGIGKTTVSIGLADGLNALGKTACLALREPSLGPVFGTKGGATGGGYSQVVPMQDINLHFNGDFHAITSANNLLASFIDNHIFQGNSLNIDKNQVLFSRCLDVNERELRSITLTSGRKDNFIITSASEIMAIMCMATSIADLKARIGNIMVALDTNGNPVYARQVGGVDAVTILLTQALMPNLVQTLNGNPAIIHCGPFANIAHGCNSVVATKLAMSVADYTITEAGFGADLGAEKFLDFKCRVSNLKPNCVVLVATIRALKLHGGEQEQNLVTENLQALKKGICNLQHHINVIKNVYKLPIVVTLNSYSTDTQAEINLVKQLLSGTKIVVNDVWGKGADGAIELANEVINACNQDNSKFSFAYNLTDSVEQKILDIVTKVYGGASVSYSDKAKQMIEFINKNGLQNLPIIMAKTQFSLSADKSLIGAPKDFNIDVLDIQVRSGAGFLVVVCGSIMLMPALGKAPAGLAMTIDDDGTISGLF